MIKYLKPTWATMYVQSQTEEFSEKSFCRLKEIGLEGSFVGEWLSTMIKVLYFNT